MNRHKDIQDRHERAIASCIRGVLGVYIRSARNAELWDVDGIRYMDFTSGIGVMNVGHSNEEVINSVTEFLPSYTHTCFRLLGYEPYVELGERLNEIIPCKGEKRSIFFTTGSEAIESAVRFARNYNGRNIVITGQGAFHGSNTHEAAYLTGKRSRVAYGHPRSDIFHIPIPDKHDNVSLDFAMHYLQRILSYEVSEESVSAIMLEMVRGEGGIVAMDKRFIRSVRELCDRHNILLIVDEIQAGFCRTGEMFAVEHFGIDVDIVVTAKALGGGFPLSAVTGKREIMNKMPSGSMGGTYSGNAVACVAGLKVLEILKRDNIDKRVQYLGGVVTDTLKDLPKIHPAITDIRGLGLMRGIGFTESVGVEAKQLTQEIIQNCKKRGVLLLAAGYNSQVIRILPPLTIEEEILREGLTIIKESIFEVLSKYE